MKSLVVLIVLCILSGCGGGTSGSASTGGFVEKTITGVLTDPSGKPLANATVEFKSTGAKTTTDSNGAFEILATVPVGKNEVVVTAKDGSKYFIETLISEDGKTVELTLVFSQQATSRYKKWQLSARVQGPGCEDAFFGDEISTSFTEEDQKGSDSEADIFGYSGVTLYQYVNVKAGTPCTLEIQVQKDGKPLPDLAYNAKFHRCHDFFTPGDPDNSVSFSQGVSGINGEISVALTIEPGGICGYNIYLPEYGKLRLGASVDVISKYSIDNS